MSKLKQYNMKMKNLNYWKENCKENYLHTHISVLRYISELEKTIELTVISYDNYILLKCISDVKGIGLTKNSEYEVIDTQQSCFVIFNDYGKDCEYDKSKFEIIIK